MMLMRLPGFEGLTTLQDRVNRLFDELVGETAPGTTQARSWLPAVDVLDTPEALVVKLEAPGIDPGRIDIAVTGDYLEVSGEKAVEETPKDGRWYRFERLTGEFRRRVQLPFPVEADKIEATAKHGLLTIHLPKRAEVMPKRIAVKSK